MLWESHRSRLSNSRACHRSGCAAVACCKVLMEIPSRTSHTPEGLSLPASECERSPCSSFFNVESMKATFHWKLQSGQRWCPLRSPTFLSSRHRMSQNGYSFLLVFPGKGQHCEGNHVVILKAKLLGQTQDVVSGEDNFLDSQSCWNTVFADRPLFVGRPHVL